MPADELALRNCQLRSLATRTPAADLLPPDPAAPHVVRHRRSLRQVAAQVVGADEVVIDLETSSLDPRSGEIVGVGLAAAGPGAEAGSVALHSETCPTARTNTLIYDFYK
jgi:hypothetical protein